MTIDHDSAYTAVPLFDKASNAATTLDNTGWVPRPRLRFVFENNVQMDSLTIYANTAAANTNGDSAAFMSVADGANASTARD